MTKTSSTIVVHSGGSLHGGAICDDSMIGDISILINYLFATGFSMDLAECL